MLVRPLITVACHDLVPPSLTAARWYSAPALHPRLRRAHGTIRGFSFSFGREAGVAGRLRGRVRNNWHVSVLARGKKTKSTVKLDDLPQGALALNPHPAQDEGPAYPTVVLQARRNMRKFDNCVLLTRVGGFYELYFEHAEEYGPLLNLKVAQKKTNAGLVSMAGFPFFQLDRFLKILVQDLNRYVAVAEEFPNNAPDKVKSGGLMHDRRVARIITPGTLIDENFMDPYANNYVLAIHAMVAPSGGGADGLVATSAAEGEGEGGAPDSSSHSTTDRNVTSATGDPAAPPMSLGLAWLDLSTGQFYTQATDLSALSSILSRICPKEVVIDGGIQAQTDHGLFSILAEDRHLVTYSSFGEIRCLSDWAPMLESEIPPATRDAFTDGEVMAGSLLLHYVKEQLLGLSMKLQPPMRHENMQIMSIDKNSMRSLEIKQTIRDGNFRGSLLHAIRRTVTKSGARLLNDWVSAPSTSIDVIKLRQDLVARFIEEPDLRDAIVLLLRRSHDSQRLVQKFALGRGDPDDLVALANTIHSTDSIRQLLTEATDESSCLARMTARLDLKAPLRLARRIKEAIDEEGIVHQHEMEESEAGQMMALAQEIVSTQGTREDAAVLPKGTAKKKRPTSVREAYADDNETWIMKPKASPVLRQLHADLAALHAERETLTEALRDEHGATSLTLRWSPALGHFCHIKGKDVRSISSSIRALSSSKSTSSFHAPEWTRLGQQLEHARHSIRTEEQRVFLALRAAVVLNLVKLRRNAAVLDELDVATSFARLAVEQGLTRPLLNNSTAHTIIGGRHPTVEGGLHEQGRSFVRNDCLVGGGGSSGGRLWLITGPNMAGKSTFLRQNALITILAQVGCYVPADYAELGVVDAIFSRVGSADNLYRDQSTFMVEMMETAQILRGATPRSFVIMDEIGRGTTPEDGTAVAYACLHHLVTVNKCRALFATHFHKVADLAVAEGLADDGKGGVEMYCTDVDEDGEGGFVYVHKLRKGVNRQSHALKVARLANLPGEAISVAQKVLGIHQRL
ncbi:MutS domain V [Colletotrichum graminicola]|uniref:MutS domain V n=1 Tax=Colletotrichum graminicola (strain M1.001 / M2 / FGSC 10212) TaxID=645133 RepID=E3Q6B3_COLGM|nr:MutS domain V [Colletotrichum graminicola M1.001]EFQ26361.1 MutS domain V [Colletotrichum graminicola M1.001]WDK14202.1 MutS domain V [Colletotrichum graminicola]